MPNKHYDTNLSDAAWALVAPLLPSARPGGRPRTTDTRAVVNAISYLLRTGCQWRMLPGEFPAWAPSITISAPGRTWACGLAYSVRSTSERAWQPVETLVHLSLSWTASR